MLPLRQLLPGPSENQPDPRSLSYWPIPPGKTKGKWENGVESLNEILNCAILTLKAPYTQAKEAERLFTPAFQQLAFL